MQPPYSGEEPPPTPNYNEPIPSVPTSAPTPSEPTAPMSGGPGGPPQIRFEAIGEAWTLFQQQMAPWILAVLLYFIVVGVLSTVAMLPFFGSIIAMDQTAADQDPMAMLGPMLGMYGVIFLVVVPASYVLMGGLYRMAIKQLRGQPISVGDLFDIGDVLLPLIGAMFLVTLAAGLAAFIGLILCGLPGLVVYALLMLTVPIIVDKRVGAVEAMKMSWNALKPHWLMATVYLFVLSLVGQLGAVACYVGILFTYPLFILGIAILYRDFFYGNNGVPQETPLPGTPGEYSAL